MKQYVVTARVQMSVSIAVRASTAEEVESWVKRCGPSLHSVVETPNHALAGIEIESIDEVFAQGFCPEITLPADEDLF